MHKYVKQEGCYKVVTFLGSMGGTCYTCNKTIFFVGKVGCHNHVRGITILSMFSTCLFLVEESGGGMCSYLVLQ